MGLADIQVRCHLEAVVDQYLKKGEYPSPSVVQGYLMEQFAKYRPGSPLTFAPEVPRNSVSSSDYYNAFFKSVESDLQVLYEHARDIVERLKAASELFRDYEQHLEHSLESLAGQVEVLGDSFRTFENIDLERTTALVDLSAGEVRLDEVEDGWHRLDLSNATLYFELLSPYIVYNTLSPLDNIKDPDDSTCWLVEVRSPTPDVLAARLTVDFGAVLELNRVEAVFQAALSCAELYASSDGQNWEQLATISPGAWSFPPIEARWLRLEMQKPPDFERDGYVYYFGIRRLNIYYKGFVESGELVSAPMKIDADVVTSLKLEADAEIPPLTDIKFYVSFGESGPWVPIDGELVLDNAPAIEKSFDSCVPLSDGSDVFALVPGVQEDIWFPELYCGRNKYLRGRTYAQIYSVPTLEDWQSVDVYAKSYRYYGKDTLFDSTAFPNMLDGQKTDNFYYYSFHAYVPQKQDRWVNFVCADGYLFSVYLNGQFVPVVGGQALLHLLAGWNDFVVLLYNSDPQKAVSRALVWDWYTEGLEFWARREPMRLVGYHELVYRVPLHKTDCYALVRVGNSWCPAFVYRPEDYALAPSDFLLKYRRPGMQAETIRLKAVLTRSPGAGRVTPRLKGYRIYVN